MKNIGWHNIKTTFKFINYFLIGFILVAFNSLTACTQKSVSVPKKQNIDLIKTGPKTSTVVDTKSDDQNVKINRTDFEQVISDFIINYSIPKYKQGQAQFEVHHIYDKEIREKEIVLYMDTYFSVNSYNGVNIEHNSGGWKLVVMMIEKSSSGKYTVKSYKTTGEGAQLLPDIKSMFPPKIAEQVIHNERVRNKMRVEMDEKIKAWFAKMNSGTPSSNKQVDNSYKLKENASEVPSDWKIYRYLEYGYEVAYQTDYNPSVSGGHSVVANSEFEMRLSLYSRNNQPSVDIDSIKIDTFNSVNNFLKIKYSDEMVSNGRFSINNGEHKIYRIKGDDYYFVFFSNESYIFQLSSSSEELLVKIARTFTFI